MKKSKTESRWHRLHISHNIESHRMALRVDLAENHNQFNDLWPFIIIVWPLALCLHECVCLCIYYCCCHLTQFLIPSSKIMQILIFFSRNCTQSAEIFWFNFFFLESAFISLDVTHSITITILFSESVCAANLNVANQKKKSSAPKTLTELSFRCLRKSPKLNLFTHTKNPNK